MTNQHRATPEQWEAIERCAASSSAAGGIIELRARIEALEAAQQRPPHQDKLDGDDGEPIVMPSSPADSLVDRVAQVINDAPNNEWWHDEARAAILEVAAWLRAESEGHLGSGLHFARRLQQEANQ
jgi:hypothetical protein